MLLLDEKMFRLPSRAGARSPNCFGQLATEQNHFLPVNQNSTGLEFDSRALTALHNHRKALGIKQLWDCRNKGVLLDGVIETDANRFIPVEITQNLSFQNFSKSCTEILGGRQLCALPSSEGLIIFESFSGDESWKNDGWRKLIEISTAIRSQINIDALLLDSDGRLHRYDQKSKSPVQINNLADG